MIDTKKIEIKDGKNTLKFEIRKMDAVSGCYSCSAWVSHCSGFSCCGAQALGHVSSAAVASRL